MGWHYIVWGVRPRIFKRRFHAAQGLMQCCNIRSSLIITFIVFTFVQRQHDSDDSFSSAATNRYNLLEATTESDSDGDLHEMLAARTQCSASHISVTAKPDADASESDADSLFTGTGTDAGSDDFEHESLPDSEPDNDTDQPLAEIEAPVKQWLSLIHKFTTDPKDSPSKPDSESESSPSATSLHQTMARMGDHRAMVNSDHLLGQIRSRHFATTPRTTNHSIRFPCRKTDPLATQATLLMPMIYLISTQLQLQHV